MAHTAPTTRRRPRQPGAFSLIELVMVLLILSAIAAIAAPRYADALSHYRTETAARRLAVDLDYARQHAINTSASQTVTFDAAAGSYELVGMQDLDRPADPYVVWLSGDPHRATMLSVVCGGDTQIVFDIYGVPDTGGQVVLTSGHWQKTVTVDADNGLVTVE